MRIFGRTKGERSIKARLIAVLAVVGVLAVGGARVGLLHVFGIRHWARHHRDDEHGHPQRHGWERLDTALPRRNRRREP